MSLDLRPAIEHPFDGIDPVAVLEVGAMIRGKVRDIIDLGDRLALVVTDRISAFDRVLGTIPYKGQILNELACWWFEELADIVPSHVLSVPDPNVTVGRKCDPLPVEVVVRGHLSGSTSTALWTRYDQGQREIYGLRFPDGMTKNDPLPTLVITPTTKARAGGHDEPVSEIEVVERGLVRTELWDQVRETAISMFERGRSIADSAGLVLVDTKYEFGIDRDGDLVVIDEVHTPDSSRFWRAETLESRLAAGHEPDNLDKEVVRLQYAARGFRGVGDPPPIDTAQAASAAGVYAEAFRRLTGSEVAPAEYPAAPRVEEIVRAIA